MVIGSDGDVAANQRHDQGPAVRSPVTRLPNVAKPTRSAPLTSPTVMDVADARPTEKSSTGGRPGPTVILPRHDCALRIAERGRGGDDIAAGDGTACIEIEKVGIDIHKADVAGLRFQVDIGSGKVTCRNVAACGEYVDESACVDRPSEDIPAAKQLDEGERVDGAGRNTATRIGQHASEGIDDAGIDTAAGCQVDIAFGEAFP